MGKEMINGEYKGYYSDGSIKHIYTFDEITKVMNTISYCKDGQVKSKGTYTKGKGLTGTMYTYNDYGVLDTMSRVVDGIKNGICIEYSYQRDEYDKLYERAVEYKRWEDEYRDGLKSGVCRTYKGDVILVEETYANGTKEGLYKEFTSKGNLREIGAYVDGYKDGKWNRWDSETDGLIETTGSYKESLKVGLWRTYFAGGNLRSEEMYDSEGSWRQGDRTFWYNNGKLHKKQYYNADEKDGIFKEWYANGQVKFDGRYEDNLPQGTHREWHENGLISYQVEFLNGMEQGLERKWYDNGQLKEEQDWRYNTRTTYYCKRWDANGELVHETHYDETGFATKKIPLKYGEDVTTSMRNGDYILWNPIDNEPFEDHFVIYNYESLAESFDNGTNDSLPMFVEPKKLSDLSPDWLTKISEAINN